MFSEYLGCNCAFFVGWGTVGVLAKKEKSAKSGVVAIIPEILHFLGTLFLESGISAHVILSNTPMSGVLNELIASLIRC